MALIAIPTVLEFTQVLKPGDEVWLAKMLAGEVNTLGPKTLDAAVLAVNVAMNRAAKPWWINGGTKASPIQQIVERDFHGTIRGTPPRWAMNAVAYALMERARGNTSQGALFLLGGIDIRANCNWSSHVDTVAWKDQSVHIFTDWPYRKEK